MKQVNKPDKYVGGEGLKEGYHLKKSVISNETARRVVALTKDTIPDCTVDGVILFKGRYIVSLSFPDDDPFLELANFHEVNLETGKVSSCLPTLSLTLDPEFVEAMKKARITNKKRYISTVWKRIWVMPIKVINRFNPERR